MSVGRKDYEATRLSIYSDDGNEEEQVRFVTNEDNEAVLDVFADEGDTDIVSKSSGGVINICYVLTRRELRALRDLLNDLDLDPDFD